MIQRQNQVLMNKIGNYAQFQPPYAIITQDPSSNFIKESYFG